MSGGFTAAEIIGVAVAANTVYGAATGETGGLVGELFGVQDNIDDKTNQAKQDAADRQAALVAAAAQPAKAPAAPAAPVAADLGSAVPVVATALGAGAQTVTLDKPPVVTPAAPMPNLNATLLAKKRESIAAQRRRQGRASTILTDDKLGG